MNYRKRPKTSNENVKIFGGRELIQDRMVNHLKAIMSIKATLDLKEPHPHVNKKDKYYSKRLEFTDQEGINLKNTYKAVASVKSKVNAQEPYTFKMGKTKLGKLPNFEDTEHVRRLNAISKRISSMGSVQERKKNINDPITNPIYFFRSPNDKNATKLVSLESFNNKLLQLKEKNKTELIAEEIFKRTCGVDTKYNKKVEFSVSVPSLQNQISKENRDKIIREKKIKGIEMDPTILIVKYLGNRKSKENSDNMEVLKNNSTEKIKECKNNAIASSQTFKNTRKFFDSKYSY